MEKLSNLGIATRCSQSLHCGWEAPNATQLRTSLARSSVCCGDRSHSPAGRRLCTAPQGAATEDGLDPFELVRVELGQLTDNIGDLIRTVCSAVRYTSAMYGKVVEMLRQAGDHPVLDEVASYFFQGATRAKHFRPAVVLLVARATAAHGYTLHVCYDQLAADVPPV